MTGLSLKHGFGTAVSWRVVIALGLPFLFYPDQHALLRGDSAGKYNEVSGHFLR